jgi:hypothetical protein
MRDHDAELPYEDYIAKLAPRVRNCQRILDVSDEEIDKLVSRREEYFKQIVDEKGLSLLPAPSSSCNKSAMRTSKPPWLPAPTPKNWSSSWANCPSAVLRYVRDGRRREPGQARPRSVLTGGGQAGVEPADCVVMEDATNGLEAAKNGGMRCIALTTTRGADQLQGADLIVGGYAEIDLLHWLEEQQSQAGSAS